jgi:hypothetical protein
MTKQEFESIKSFNKDTKGLNNKTLFDDISISKIDYKLMQLIDNINIEFKKKYGIELKIHTLYDTGGHSKNSYHYKGLACDFSFTPNRQYYFTTQIKYLVDYLTKNNIYDKIGLGIYYEWRNRGFHLDIRGKQLSWYQELGLYFYKPINWIIDYLTNKGL